MASLALLYATILSSYIFCTSPTSFSLARNKSSNFYNNTQYIHELSFHITRTLHGWGWKTAWYIGAWEWTKHSVIYIHLHLIYIPQCYQ